jgi:uncharacterized protein YjbJ (UPF0337 family)
MAGKPTKVKGQVEEVVGIITGNKKLESKGKVDRRVGEVKEKVSRVKDKVDKTTDKIERKAGKVIDKSKGLGHKK